MIEWFDDRNKNLLLKECLLKCKPYLKDIIIDLQESDTWKIQLTIVINFIFSKDAWDERVMHSKSNSEEVVIFDNADYIVDKFSKALLQYYLETSMRGSDFI